MTKLSILLLFLLTILPSQGLPNDNAYLLVSFPYIDLRGTEPNDAGDNYFMDQQYQYQIPHQPELEAAKAESAEALLELNTKTQQVLANRKAQLNQRESDAMVNSFYDDKDLTFDVGALQVRKQNIASLQNKKTSDMIVLAKNLFYSLGGFDSNHEVPEDAQFDLFGLQLQDLDAQIVDLSQLSQDVTISWDVAAIGDLHRDTNPRVPSPNYQIQKAFQQAETEIEPAVGWECSKIKRIWQMDPTWVPKEGNLKAQVNTWYDSNADKVLNNPEPQPPRFSDLSQNVYYEKAQLEFEAEQKSYYETTYSNVAAARRLLASSKSQEPKAAAGSSSMPKDPKSQGKQPIFKAAEDNIQDYISKIMEDLGVELQSEGASFVSFRDALLLNKEQTGARLTLKAASIKSAISDKSYVVIMKYTLSSGNFSTQRYIALCLGKQAKFEETDLGLGVYDKQNIDVEVSEPLVDLQNYSFGFKSSTVFEGTNPQVTLLVGLARQFRDRSFQRQSSPSVRRLVGNLPLIQGSALVILLGYYQKLDGTIAYQIKVLDAESGDSDQLDCRNANVELSLKRFHGKTLNEDDINALAQGIKEKQQEKAEKKQSQQDVKLAKDLAKQEVRSERPRGQAVQRLCGQDEDNLCNSHGTCQAPAKGNKNHEVCVCSSDEYVLPFCLTLEEQTLYDQVLAQKVADLKANLSGLKGPELRDGLQTISAVLKAGGASKDTRKEIRDTLKSAILKCDSSDSAMELISARLDVGQAASTDPSLTAEELSQESVDAQNVIQEAVAVAGDVSITVDTPSIVINVEGVSATVGDLELTPDATQSEIDAMNAPARRFLAETTYKVYTTDGVTNDDGSFVQGSTIQVPSTHKAVTNGDSIVVSVKADSIVAGSVDLSNVASLVLTISFVKPMTSGQQVVTEEVVDATNLIRINVGLKNIIGENEQYVPALINSGKFETAGVTFITNDQYSVTFTVQKDGDYAVQILPKPTVSSSSSLVNDATKSSYSVALSVSLLAIMMIVV